MYTATSLHSDDNARVTVTVHAHPNHIICPLFLLQSHIQLFQAPSSVHTRECHFGAIVVDYLLALNTHP